MEELSKILKEPNKNMLITWEVLEENLKHFIKKKKISTLKMDEKKKNQMEILELKNTIKRNKQPPNSLDRLNSRTEDKRN